jgi:16S rRNA (guanine(1405)-N(7))-methyltransferase
MIREATEELDTAGRERVVLEIERSRKYRHLCDETIDRIARWALARHRSVRDATKAAKRKLHQVHSAYCGPASAGELAGAVARLPDPAAVESMRAGCLALLRRHASTAERIPIMDELYSALADEVGPVSSVLDLACGHHPFALPWMRLRPEVAYHARDIDRRVVAAVGVLLSRLGRPGTARCGDLLAGPVDVEADLVLLLKTLPCLEQQEKGSSLRLLAGLPGRHVAVSFPVASLGGGRNRGMRANYDRWMGDLVERLGAPARRLELATETLWLLGPRAPPERRAPHPGRTPGQL